MWFASCSVRDARPRRWEIDKTSSEPPLPSARAFVGNEKSSTTHRDHDGPSLVRVARRNRKSFDAVICNRGTANVVIDCLRILPNDDVPFTIPCDARLHDFGFVTKTTQN